MCVGDVFSRNMRMISPSVGFRWKGTENRMMMGSCNIGRLGVSFAVEIEFVMKIVRRTS